MKKIIQTKWEVFYVICQNMQLYTDKEKNSGKGLTSTDWLTCWKGTGFIVK